MNELLLKLEKLGLSSYEAKALLALMQKHPANGYEVSKLAKVPPSKIYETLKRLKNKGVIITDEQVDPVQYYPIPHEKLIHMLKQEYASTIEALEQELQEIQPLPNIDLSWNLFGCQAVVAKIIQVIEKSSEILMLSIWPQEFGMIRGAVKMAEQRGVKVIAAIFGETEFAGPYVINLSKCGETSQKRLNSRLTTVIADSNEVVISEISESVEAVGVWTEIPAIVLIAKEYIKHDIWGSILIDTLGDAKFKQLSTENDLLAFLIQNR
jgi:HTH-type transcriptional regulator, sugar sensing transcriptional regulator